MWSALLKESANGEQALFDIIVVLHGFFFCYHTLNEFASRNLIRHRWWTVTEWKQSKECIKQTRAYKVTSAAALSSKEIGANSIDYSGYNKVTGDQKLEFTNNIIWIVITRLSRCSTRSSGILKVHKIRTNKGATDDWRSWGTATVLIEKCNKVSSATHAPRLPTGNFIFI